MRTLQCTLLALTLVLLSVACGSSESAALEAANDDGPDSPEGLAFSSPLADFLGIEIEHDREALFAEIENVAAGLTQECMAKAGFEYTPSGGRNNVFFGPGTDELPYFSDEWVEKFGFGISTQRFPQSMVGELVGLESDDEGNVDPNEEYIDSLSTGEREAFYDALTGSPPDFGSAGPDPNTVYQQGGCVETSFDQAFADGPGRDIVALYDTFGDELDAIERRTRADPRLIDFSDRVSACVSATGLLWIDLQEFNRRMEKDLNSVMSRALSGDAFEAASSDPDLELDDSQMARLAEIQAEEVELAKVVADCGGGPLNEQVVLSEVRADYERQFLDEKRDAVREYLDE